MATRKMVRKVRRTAASTLKAHARPVRRAAKHSPAARAAEVLRGQWEAATSALGSAQHAVEKQVRGLRKKGIHAGDAKEMIDNLRVRFGRERKKLAKQIDSRFKTIQSTLKKERKVMGRRMDDAVKATLAALNIPSRHEVAELTGKVETLSRKIDSFRR